VTAFSASESPCALPIIRREPRGGGWLHVWRAPDPDWVHIALPVPALPPALAGVRLIHLTDVHLNRFWHRSYDRLLRRLADARADAVLLTGDLVDNRWDPSAAVPLARRFLAGLNSRWGTFAVLGNHDGDLTAELLRAAGCHLLHPGRAVIPVGDARLELLGLPCVSRLDFSDRLLDRYPPRLGNSARIVLSHYPDHVLRLGPLHPDVVLAGHTHGGQVCLPGGHPIITHDDLPKSMCHGMHRVNDTWLLVSRGVGYATYPIRLFAPPEVFEVELRGANPEDGIALGGP
jgi:hypothetical protein